MSESVFSNLAEVHEAPDDLLAAIDYCYEQGWTDGLPVVPPEASRVESMLAAKKYLDDIRMSAATVSDEELAQAYAAIRTRALEGEPEAALVLLRVAAYQRSED